MKIITLVLLTILLSACGGEDSSSSTTHDAKVYTFTGQTQCNNDGKTKDEAMMSLIENGIDVLQTECGHQSGVLTSDVCGGSTSYFYAFTIRSVNLEHAEEINYFSLDNLVDEENGVDYQLYECGS